jgi:S-ribosylhomocysteine lyase LuxS involved in autoinducer biosynthesis
MMLRMKTPAFTLVSPAKLHTVEGLVGKSMRCFPTDLLKIGAKVGFKKLLMKNVIQQKVVFLRRAG